MTWFWLNWDKTAKWGWTKRTSSKWIHIDVRTTWWMEKAVRTLVTLFDVSRSELWHISLGMTSCCLVRLNTQTILIRRIVYGTHKSRCITLGFGPDECDREAVRDPIAIVRDGKTKHSSPSWKKVACSHQTSANKNRGMKIPSAGSVHCRPDNRQTMGERWENRRPPERAVPFRSR